MNEMNAQYTKYREVGFAIHFAVYIFQIPFESRLCRFAHLTQLFDTTDTTVTSVTRL